MSYRLIKKNPKDLKLSPNNIRKINPKVRHEAMTLSVKHYNGPFIPVIINLKDELVCGQRRWLAALEANIPLIDCLQRDFTEEEEILLSWLENELQEPVDARDRSKAVRKLLSLGHTYEDLEIISGLPRSTLHALALVSQIPESIQQAKEEPVKEKAIEKIQSLHPRRRVLVDRALKYKPMKEDIHQSLEFIEWAEKAPLHDIEERVKELREGMKIDMELAKKQVEKPQEWVFRTARIHESIDKRVKEKCKRQAKDYNAVINNLLDLWSRDKIEDTL